MRPVFSAAIGDQSRAAAEKWVDDDIATVGEIEQSVLQYRGSASPSIVNCLTWSKKPGHAAPNNAKVKICSKG
jgi:hypothetical protein